MRMKFIIFSVLFPKILREIYYGYVPEFLSMPFAENPGGINREKQTHLVPDFLWKDKAAMFR